MSLREREKTMGSESVREIEIKVETRQRPRKTYANVASAAVALAEHAAEFNNATEAAKKQKQRKQHAQHTHTHTQHTHTRSTRTHSHSTHAQYIFSI